MKSIFILGASRLQIPAIKKAKEKGLFVYALDYDSKAIGIPFADKFLEISTIDKEAVYEAALKYKPDYIITSTSDMPVRTVSWVCEKLGKKTDISYEGAICATDKVAMLRCMEKSGVPIPKYYQVSNIQEFFSTIKHMPEKIVVKPADSSASRGVVYIDKNMQSDFENVYNYSVQFSHSGDLIVEEFLEGPEVSVESYSVNGEPHIITITDKIVSKLPFFVELGHTEPSRLSISQQDEVRNIAIAAAKAIGMRNGPTHAEIKITPTGAKLVEIAARLGGDFITSKLVPLSTGVDMIECSFSSMLNEKVSYERTISKGSAIRFIQGTEGVFTGVEGLEEVKEMKGIYEIEIYINPGDIITSLKNSNDRIGHIIAVGKDATEAARIAKIALDKISVNIKVF